MLMKIFTRGLIANEVLIKFQVVCLQPFMHFIHIGSLATEYHFAGIKMPNLLQNYEVNPSFFFFLG